MMCSGRRSVDAPNCQPTSRLPSSADQSPRSYSPLPYQHAASSAAIYFPRATTSINVPYRRTSLADVPSSSSFCLPSVSTRTVGLGDGGCGLPRIHGYFDDLRLFNAGSERHDAASNASTRIADSWVAFSAWGTDDAASFTFAPHHSAPHPTRSQQCSRPRRQLRCTSNDPPRVGRQDSRSPGCSLYSHTSRSRQLSERRVAGEEPRWASQGVLGRFWSGRTSKRRQRRKQAALHNGNAGDLRLQQRQRSSLASHVEYTRWTSVNARRSAGLGG